MKLKEILQGWPYLLAGAAFVFVLTTERDRAYELIERHTVACEKLVVLLEQAQKQEERNE